MAQEGLPDVEHAAKMFVEDAVKGNAVVVFAKSLDPFSKKAKAALAHYLPVSDMCIIDIDKRTGEPSGAAIQNGLAHLLGGASPATIPRVFIGGKLVGGGGDVERLHAAGQLRGLLEAAGATLA